MISNKSLLRCSIFMIFFYWKGGTSGVVPHKFVQDLIMGSTRINHQTVLKILLYVRYYWSLNEWIKKNTYLVVIKSMQRH